MDNTSNGARKSFYVFLTSLLGVLLFLILHRVVVFMYLYLVAGGYLASTYNYLTFLFWDYFTLTIALMLGAWYGVWLGLNWFDMVYINKSHGGLVDHIARHYWIGGKPKALEVKMSGVKERLEKDLQELEGLAKVSISESLSQPQPKVRTVVRKRAPKKLNSL